MGLLGVENLTVRYGENPPAVDRVHLELLAGESLGLVGESGSGKSTIGRSLLHLLPESATVDGRIVFQQELLSGLSERDWQPYRGSKISLIFQDPMTRLNPLMTIEEHGLEVLRSHRPHLSRRQARHQVQEALRAVRIDPARRAQYPHEFSGGMRQRAAIALSILLDPLLLIADEPTTSLDVTVAAEILQELTLLRQQRGMALLLITHDLGLVAQYCDRLAVMFDGTVVETGPTAQLLDRPQHPYTQNLLRSVLRFHSDRPYAVSDREDKAEPLLTVRNLTKIYASNPLATLFNRAAGPIRAVDGIDLDIYPGDILGIIGESGSGKSTTARAILQLIRPDRGSVAFDGIELTRLGGRQMRHMRRQMQMIFQDPRAAFNPRMTVAQSVADPLLVHRMAPDRTIAREAVALLLERVGLSRQLLDRLPHELSGGQLQRVAIARALITHPRFLVCDEPVSMLDATIQSQILQLMLDLRSEYHLTYLFITHDLAVAKFFCTHVVVMYRGEIVERGTTAEVFGNPQHAYTQKLIASVSHQGGS